MSSRGWLIRLTVRTLTLGYAVLGGLVLFSIVLLAAGKNPLDTYASLVGSTLGSDFGLTEVFVKLIPILFTALAVAIPARLGLVNVGGEGQLYSGALFASFAALALGPQVPAWVGIPVSVVCGMAGGALWALVPAWLRSTGWLNETISTLLLNYVALRLVDFFIFGALRDGASANVPQTVEFGPGWVWPAFVGRIHLGLVLALVCLAATALVLNRTRWGYEIRAVGGNPLAAQRHGLPLSGYVVVVMLAGGALAGLAGTGEIMAIQGRLRPHFSPDYGYLGFLVAWLAGHKPLRILLLGFLVAVVSTGGDSLQLD
ncbi:MAG TPA: ABC transporter permease, partial [Spirochaetia bacterium]|nr:ABC transporter permease [Spirochaetia bacterium]